MIENLQKSLLILLVLEQQQKQKLKDGQKTDI